MLHKDLYVQGQPGVQMFLPEDPAVYDQGNPCRGFGTIRYDDGSEYCGDLYFDGTLYRRLGYGRQNLLLTDMGALDPVRKVRRAFYIGQFDERKTGWIYGNGVFYYVDENLRPVCFVKGFYESIDLVGPYTGELTEDMLAYGYTWEMEANIDHWADVFQQQIGHAGNVEELENLMIGDSYFEFWDMLPFAGEHQFYPHFANQRNLNLGIAGTRFSSWMRFLPQVVTLPQPQRIFLNLGFNDLHVYNDPEKAYRDYRTMLAELKKAFPGAEYYLLNVVQSPAFLAWEAQEETLNRMTAESAAELGVHVVDMRTVVRQAGGLDKVFDADQIHLNPLGYAALNREIRKILENE